MAAAMKRHEIDRELDERPAGKLEEDLRFVDLLCVQWAREVHEWDGRERNIIHRMIREREGAVTGHPVPISDNVQALDSILAKSDPRYHALVFVWYVHGGSIKQKAQRLHTNRTDLYGVWRRTLEYLKGRLHGVGIET